ncbi:MAG: glycoside hydrolase family 25 protein [Bacteroidaceae bacterium]|nr:glycoside hydrolase family 25 protein [Bacteroidaceae bacterium]
MPRHKKKTPNGFPHSWGGVKGGLIAALVVALYVWVFYAFFVSPTGFRWRALFGDPKYPGGYEIHGIDISYYQEDINWSKLQFARIDNCPLRFILVKATEGSSHIDPKFKENFDNAKEYGFKRGAYHFWSNRSSAKSQALFFLDNVHLTKGDLPPVLDVENKPKDMPLEEFQRNLLAWLHTVEDAFHCKPIIYTYYKFKQENLNTPVFDNYPLWIAHYYVDEMNYQGEWKFWQHTDTGKLPGIKGYVDFNVYNGSAFDLERLCLE